MAKRKDDSRTPLFWVGNKSEMIDETVAHLPERSADRKWLVPFCGSMAAIFVLKPERAVLSDQLPDLVDFWCWVRDDPSGLHARASAFSTGDYRANYEAARRVYNSKAASGKQDLERSAAWLYVNRYGFRGRFRVNGKGLCNIPVDHTRKNMTLPSLSVLTSCSDYLRLPGITIVAEPWQRTLMRAKSGDFALLDPPYDGVYDYSDMYADSKPFNRDSQLSLRVVCSALDAKGVSWLVHNNPTSYIQKLWAGSKRFTIVDRDHKIGYGKTIKPGAAECLMTNF